MNRPMDWAPLAQDDPVPGDPDRVAALAARNADLADVLAEQAVHLRSLSAGEGWDSDAGRVASRSAGALAGRLEQARRRYSVVADALRGYAPELSRAQAEADAARAAARDAQARLEATPPPPEPSGVPAREAAIDLGRRQARGEAVDDLERARRRLAAAVHDRDTAAGLAERRIREVVDGDGLRDGFWDRTKDWAADRWDEAMRWVHDHAASIRFVADVCGMIATALSLIAVVISFIPVLNVLAPILLWAAFALTVVAAVCHVALALSGDGSWLDVGLDILAMVTFGYGRTAAKALTVARAGAKASARTALANAARDKGAPAVRRLSRSVASRPVPKATRKAAIIELREMKRRAARSAARQIKKAGRERLPVPRSLAYLDGGTARIVGEVRGMVRYIGGVERLRAADDAVFSRAAGDVITGARKMAGVGAVALAVDIADRSTTLTLPNGTTLDLNLILPDKPGLLDPVKGSVTWGRYAS